jgi:hypothetical protein
MFAKRSALALALALVGTSLSLPGRVEAQQAPQALKPATNDDTNTYLRMAAINMCTLAQSKVPFQAAMRSNVSMVVDVIIGKHGGVLPGMQSALKPEDLANRTVPPIVLNVQELCGKNLPAEWKKDFDPLLTKVNQVIQSGRSAVPKK